MKHWVQIYAEDQKLFFQNYARAHVKISERGQEENLLTEFDESDIVDGGYMENKGQHWSTKYRDEEDLAEETKEIQA